MKFYRNVLNGSVVHELSMVRAIDPPLPASLASESFPIIHESGQASLLAIGAVGNVRYVISWNSLPEYRE